MGRPPGVHYTGRLAIWRGNKWRLSWGVACTSGAAARRIEADSCRTTTAPKLVTCSRCRRPLEEHKRSAQLAAAEAKRIIAFARDLEREQRALTEGRS